MTKMFDDFMSGIKEIKKHEAGDVRLRVDRMEVEMIKKERLMEIRETLSNGDHLTRLDRAHLTALIDAEIVRQSATDEAVKDAITWAEQEHGYWMRYMMFGYADSASLAITALQSYQPTTRKNRTVEEAAISKTETTSNSCWYCKGIELHNIKSVKTVTDESDRELGAYDTPYNFCPNCGRKLVKHDG